MREVLVGALLALGLTGQVVIGGPEGPGGKVVTIDLPQELRHHNLTGRDGAGLCVYASARHADEWQGTGDGDKLFRAMTKERGGSDPEKFDKTAKKYAPGLRYVQYTGKNPEILERALHSGRLPCVTYCGKDPHYRGGSVSHMVNLVHLDEDSACVLDNNFVGPRELVWMSRQEFLDRWTEGRSGWAIILTAPGPPPVPKNGG